MSEKRKQQVQEAAKRYEAKRKAKRQEEKNIMPIWKAVACIEAMIKSGATFNEAMQVLYDVADEKGLTLRAERLLEEKHCQEGA